MATVATGLWHDYSSSAVLGVTLTLSVDNANYLLSGLTVLVTLAAASFWNITSFALHHFLARKSRQDDVDLQHRVLLRQPATVGASIIWLLKVHVAWRGKGREGLLFSTLGLLLPAVAVLGSFSAASILTSKVANKSYGGTLARVNPSSCGNLVYNNNNSIAAQSYRYAKMMNDTVRARSYVRDFYYGSLSSASQWSIFPQATLPYAWNRNVSCPFPSASRCLLGEDTAFSMTTDYLDSHSSFGINAPPSDRVSLQIRMTCSPVKIDDLGYTTQKDNQTFVGVNMGPLMQNVTSTYETVVEVPNSRMTYYIQPAFALAGNSADQNGWQPIADFNSTDADTTVYFLSQYGVGYEYQVDDPFFSAHRPWSGHYTADSLITALGCTTQYSVCNQARSVCTNPSGMNIDISSLALNAEQLQTLNRIWLALAQASPDLSVVGLKQNALWANDQLFNHFSCCLPPYQWQYEASGWYQTMLAMLQGFILEYATKAGETAGPGVDLQNPYGQWDRTNSTIRDAQDALQNQCVNQLMSTSGQVQNFSFVGIMVIVCATVAIVLLDWSLESLVNAVWSRKTPSTGKTARQLDSKLHLLRMALPDGVNHEVGQPWTSGFMDVPVRSPQVQSGTSVPVDVDNLASYRKKDKLTSTVTEVHTPETMHTQQYQPPQWEHLYHPNGTQYNYQWGPHASAHS